jgi:AcrR family transcriptional regulator
MEADATGARATGSPREYDSTSRKASAGVTRERIVAAGSALLHDAPVRDWRSVTVRAVAERAGVNERTVYRHFRNERGLRDAIMHRLEEEAGVDLTSMRLEDIAEVASRIFEHVSDYPLEPRERLDPTLSDASRRQRESLVAAVSTATSAWPDADRTATAALFDVLWSVNSYEHLVVDWKLDHDDAVRAITFLIGLLAEATGQDRRPA